LAALKEPSMDYIVIKDQTYPVDTIEQTEEAADALRGADIAYAVIYVGDPEDPDSYPTTRKLFASERPLTWTVDQIRALRDEAAKAGDEEMVRTCTEALRGDRYATVACARAIRDAAAQGDR
jgi:hypothetical protein